ncbi:Ldh family oxidoreductase [Thermovenabulum gondwanense]|uniref:Putative oxidoreductase YjmC n=1 Tax=Thermovenabulum gondwanense TaxID=520767 RepID=A0A161RD21_9FIRM|nr:Ldh family oxidoreductase [Thermovenabulum gondwanense]KYO68739.1 putative oxidoreductase YjmC [Thermovenabulum gondwanense]
MDSAVIPVSKLREFLIELFKEVGLNNSHAGIVADSILCAELRGVKSHGLVRVSTYIERVEKKATNINAKIKTEKIKKATALINADHGFGQIAGFYGMKLAITLAKKYGVGLVGIKNSNHFGIASFYSMLALKHDMIGIVLTNSSPAIAPYGSSKPLLGTNPLSIAIPSKEEKPIILDMSTSVVARGKIRLAKLKNQKIPFGWALDSSGRDTDDPDLALKGSLVPIGGPKGSGLSLVIDILCGVLTNTCLTGEVKNVTDMTGPSKTGHLFCAVNIADFIEKNVFKSNIDEIIRKIKSLPSINNLQIFLPGEIENNLEEKSLREGINLDSNLIDELSRLASRYKIKNLI